jgi:hypothetical protein
MRDDKKHFLLIDEVKMRLKKKCGVENRKTQILLQAIILFFGIVGGFLNRMSESDSSVQQWERKSLCQLINFRKESSFHF